jgi:sec-independent protein translocase protein TatA
MGHFSMMHWIVVAIVVLVLFGRGKISETMGDFGKGMKAFRRGMADEEPAKLPPAGTELTQQAPAATATVDPASSDRS